MATLESKGLEISRDYRASNSSRVCKVTKAFKEMWAFKEGLVCRDCKVRFGLHKDGKEIRDPKRDLVFRVLRLGSDWSVSRGFRDKLGHRDPKDGLESKDTKKYGDCKAFRGFRAVAEHKVWLAFRVF
jgi:hypothetical protein